VRARTRRRTTPFGAFATVLLGVALMVSGCTWGSGAADSSSPTSGGSTSDGSGDDGEGAQTEGPVAVGSPIVTPTALERAGNAIGSVREALDTWADENCDDPDCLVYVVDPDDATDDCTYVGSDPGPNVAVEEGSTVILFADCDEVTDLEEPESEDPGPEDSDDTASGDVDGGA
jgi:hypothetical protein